MADMQPGDIATWVGVVISAFAFVVAVIALVISGVAQHKANAAQLRIVEIEEQRDQQKQHEALQAKLRPELRQTGQHSYRLYLMNTGAVEAQNIRVEMDDVPLAEHPAASEPMPELVGPDGEISCLLGLHMGCTPPFKIKVTWDDTSGKDRSYCSTLTW